MKRYLIMALIVSMLIPAAFAYTEEFYIEIPGTAGGFGGIVGDLYFKDIDTSITTSKVTVVRPLYIESGHDAHPSGSLSGLGIYDGFAVGSGTLVGNGSMDWTCGDDYQSYENMCTFNYYIDDLLPTLSGIKTLRFGTTVASVGQTQLYICSDFVGCFAKANATFTTAEPWAIYSRSGTSASNGTYTVYSGNSTPIGPPTADYSCNVGIPPYEYPGFGLICTDNSTAEPPVSSIEWVLTQPDASEYTTTDVTLTKTLDQSGWYGLDFEACNIHGCSYKNTTQLVNITDTPPAASGISLMVHTYDATKHAKVAPSNINIQNTSTGTWSNWTATGGTMTFTSTDEPTDAELLSVGQTVKLCGYAPGYAQTCGNLTIPYNNYEHIINLIATDALPIGTNSTLIVSVIDGRTSSRISGAAVAIANTTVMYADVKICDANGVCTFSNIPAAAGYRIRADKAGYQPAITFWPVASGEVTNMWISILPTGETPVPTDTYGNPIYETPTTRITLAPGATPTLTDDQKDDAMMGILRDNGETLIQFFILCFVLYMIMGIGGKR